MPTWLGDCVMATPTLRALRSLYPHAQITALVRHNVRPILIATPWIDRIISIRPKRQNHRDARRKGTFALAKRLAAGKFDMAVLLPNSFRSALVVAMAKIPCRVGYDRDGRGFLLTDRLLPRKQSNAFIPVPTREYYLGLARYLGASNPDPAMQLFTRPEDDQAADELLKRGGYDKASGKPLVLLNPGANYGDAKMWFPQRYGELADLFATRWNATVAVNGAPKEREILDSVIAAAQTPILDLPKLGSRLNMLNSIVAKADIMITNDTGPRHIAAAVGTPVVTIFGPTDPAWTEIGFAKERQVMVDVFCGPCQKKKCPLDHRCMTQISPEMVFARAAELLPTTEARA